MAPLEEMLARTPSAQVGRPAFGHEQQSKCARDPYITPGSANPYPIGLPAGTARLHQRGLARDAGPCCQGIGPRRHRTSPLGGPRLCLQWVLDAVTAGQAFVRSHGRWERRMAILTPQLPHCSGDTLVSPTPFRRIRIGARLLWTAWRRFSPRADDEAGHDERDKGVMECLRWRASQCARRGTTCRRRCSRH